MAYDFSVLNDRDFEELSRDILNAKFNLDLQSFRSGKDGGIDLRFSTQSNKNYLLVQAKHYYSSSFSTLKSKLREELHKVRKLNPSEYWITTSAVLSPQNKDEILEIFSPFIRTSNAIVSLDDIKKYLFEFPKVEEKWYKLWMTSTNVLKLIIANAINGRSQFYEEIIKTKIKLYVKNYNFKIAFDILKENKFLLITGQPGVGKTTLANLISYYLLAEGYSLIYIDGSIRDAEDVFNNDKNSKQIFYFDDFLGSNYYEIKNPKSSESGLVNFLERICSSKNKYLILTSRTTIYKSALTQYEKLGNSRIDFAKKEIELEDYNLMDKAKILYNHIYFSELPDEYRKVIFKDKNYWKILNHKNYTPRIIEFFSDYKKLIKVEESKYMQYIMDKLDNPEDIWRFAFLNQITDEDRIFILTISTFRDSVTLYHLQKAYEHRIQLEIKSSNFQPTHDSFNNCIKRLLDGFIKTEMVFDTKEIIVSFINPSVKDFLINYLSKSISEKWAVIEGCIYTEQIRSIALSQYLNQNIKKLVDSDDLLRFNSFIKDNYPLFTSISSNTGNKDEYTELMLMDILNDLMDFDDVYDSNDEFIHDCLFNINLDNLTSLTFPCLFNILKYVKKNGMTEVFVKQNWNNFVTVLIKTAASESELIGVVNLFDDFEEVYFEYLENPENSDLIKVISAKYQENGTYDFFKKRRKFDIEEFENFENGRQINTRTIVNSTFEFDKNERHKNFQPEPIIEKTEQSELAVTKNDLDLWGILKKERLITQQDYIDDLFS